MTAGERPTNGRETAMSGGHPPTSGQPAATPMIVDRLAGLTSRALVLEYFRRFAACRGICPLWSAVWSMFSCAGKPILYVYSGLTLHVYNS